VFNGGAQCIDAPGLPASLLRAMSASVTRVDAVGVATNCRHAGPQ
jgi:hypothetical protein